jgi:outer membrane autotransporter protein
VGQNRGAGASADHTVNNSRWGYFWNGQIGTGDKDATENEDGFDYVSTTITAGADYRANKNFVIGGALGIVSSDSDIDRNGGNADTFGYSVAIYGTYFTDNNFYIDTIISFGQNDYKTTRNIKLLNETASGDTEGTQTTLSIGVGHNFVDPDSGWEIDPFLKFNYFKADVDGYSETGNTALLLEIKDQEIESSKSVLGVQLSITTSTGFGVLTPTWRLEYIHEFQDDSRALTARYVHDPFNDGSTLFHISTDSPDRNYFIAGTGLSAVLQGDQQAFIYYEVTRGLANIDNNVLSIGYRSKF